MAAIFGDSFDTYVTADFGQKGWTSTTGSPTIASALNGNGLRMVLGGGVLNYIKSGLTTSGSTAICGFAFNTSTLGHSVDDVIFSFRSGSTVLFGLALETVTGAFYAIRSGVTAVGSTSSYTIPTSSWVYIEMKVVLASGATGSYEVRVNGTTILTGSSVVTSPGPTTWDGFMFGTTSSGGGTPPTWLFDDFYLCDGSGATNNDFVGPIQYDLLRPSGIGTYTQMTPSAGSNYQCVDDATSNGDTDYVTETTVGHMDTYAMGNTTLSGTVKFVQATTVVRSDGAGSETVAPVFRISGADYVGTAKSVGLSYVHQVAMYNTSPATSAAWTTSELDGAEYGQKLVS